MLFPAITDTQEISKNKIPESYFKSNNCNYSMPLGNKL